MCCQGIGEAVRRAAYASPAGDHLQSGIAHARMTATVQPAPQIVVFGSGNGRPAAGPQVGIRPDAEVGSVNMRMSSVCVDAIRVTKAKRNMCPVFREVMHVDNACDRVGAVTGKAQLIG